MYRPNAALKPPRDASVPLLRYLRLHQVRRPLGATRRLHFARLDRYRRPLGGRAPPGARSPSRRTRLPPRARRDPRRHAHRLAEASVRRCTNRIGKLCTYANCWYDERARLGRHVAGSTAPRASPSAPPSARLCASAGRRTRTGPRRGDGQYLDFRRRPAADVAAARSPRVLQAQGVRARARVAGRGRRAAAPAGRSARRQYDEYRDKHPIFMKVAVDLDTLIERVYVAPGQPETFRDEIRAALQRAWARTSRRYRRALTRGRARL